MADQIVADVAAHLQGDVGIRRYVGDSYWFGDYRTLFPADERSGDFSENMERRDRHLKTGEEAQWCIFDPIMAAIYGNRYLQSGDRVGPREADCLFQPEPRSDYERAAMPRGLVHRTRRIRP